MEKAGFGPNEIKKHKGLIDSLAFRRADSIHTEEAFHNFILKFNEASQLPEATAKRDSLAFLNASQLHTYESYQAFIQKYPEAKEVKVARENYNILLFEAKTGVHTLESYVNFIKDYPENPYRRDAEELLYDKVTADNRISTFQNFLQEYPNSFFIERAKSWIWFLSEDKESLIANDPFYKNQKYVQTYLATDSVRFYTFFDQESHKFGFMNEGGVVKLEPQYDGVMEDYLCGRIDDDILVAYIEGKAGALDKSGNIIAPFEYESLSPFGVGAILSKKNGKYGLVQQTGFQLLENIYDGLEFLSNSLVKVRKGRKSGIITYNGYQVLPCEYEQVRIDQESSIVTLGNYGKYAFISEAALLDHIGDPDFDPRLTFDSYDISHENFIKINSNGTSMLKRIADNELIIESADKITDSPGGWVVENHGTYAIYNLEGRKISPVDYKGVLIGKKGFGVKVSDKWGIINQEGELFVQPVYDTIFFVGEVGILLEKDNKKSGYFYEEGLTDFSKYQSLDIQTAYMQIDSLHYGDVPFIITTDRFGRKGLLTGYGENILDNRYQQINLMDNEMVMVNNQGKRGLVDLRGNVVLRPNYDGIVNYKKGYFSLLKDKKFGLFNSKTQDIVPAQYDALVKFYGGSDSLFIAKKGLFGLINKKNEVLADFQFEEINYWNDTTLLVKHQSRWKLYVYPHNYFIPEVFDKFEYLKNTHDEVIIITYRSSGYGLLSSKDGRVIPEEYSEIINLGDQENPFYLVDKDVSQANLYILLYINRKGQVVRQQVLNEPDYEQVVCPF